LEREKYKCHAQHQKVPQRSTPKSLRDHALTIFQAHNPYSHEKELGGAAWSVACLRLAEPGLSPASDFGHFAFPGGLSRSPNVQPRKVSGTTRSPSSKPTTPTRMKKSHTNKRRLRPCRGARATVRIELAPWVVVEGFAVGVTWRSRLRDHALTMFQAHNPYSHEKEPDH
jgi:hypothetical protein